MGHELQFPLWNAHDSWKRILMIELCLYFRIIMMIYQTKLVRKSQIKERFIFKKSILDRNI